MRPAASLLTVLLLACALAPSAACRSKGEGAGDAPVAASASAPLPALDARHLPLRADFDRDAAHPRLLVLASPT